MLSLFLGASALLAGRAAADCTRELLGQVASKFVDTVKNDGSSLELASPFTYTENFKDAELASGVFSKAIKVAHTRTLLDGPGCAIYVEIIATDNKPAYHIGTQIFVDEAGKAKKVEAIINSDAPNSSSWFFNATRTLSVIQKEEAEGGRAVIAEAKRDSRETLKQVADDYFSIFGGAGTAKKSPKFAPGCMRQEGGFPTSIPCSVGVPGGSSSSSTKGSAPKSGSSSDPSKGSAPKAGSGSDPSKGTAKGGSSSGRSPIRGYVIDETVGSVEVFAYFGGAAPDTHDFRVENGQVRYVHAITVMSLGGGSSGGGGLSSMLSGLFGGSKSSGGAAPKAKGLPKETTPKETTPKEAAPKQAAPKEAAPKEVAPKEVAPKETAPKNTAPKDAAPKDAAPKEAAPKEAAPKETAPKETVPKGAT